MAQLDWINVHALQNCQYPFKDHCPMDDEVLVLAARLGRKRKTEIDKKPTDFIFSNKKSGRAYMA